LITVDTLRADHLGCYGYERDTSPHIDEFSRDALLFEHCFSHAPETRSSMASLFSGFLPHETRTLQYDYIPQGVTTLAEHLQGEGYKSMAVVSNWVLRRGQGFEQGFSIYDDTMQQSEQARKWPERVAEGTTDAAIELLRQFSHEKIFLWVHYQDPHGPYTPPEPFSAQFPVAGQEERQLPLQRVPEHNPLLALSGRGGIPSYQVLGEERDYHHYVSQYDGEIRYTDAQIGRLLDVLKELGLYEEALILFSSDHGEGMGEHDYYFAHGEYLYRQLIHVPLIVKHGKRLRGRREYFVQHVDLLPTILKTCEMPVDTRLRGGDLRTRPAAARDILALMNSGLVEDGIKFSLIREPLQLIYTLLSRQAELFDLRTDRHQEHDLAAEESHRDQAKEMLATLGRLNKEDRLQLGQTRPPRKLTEKELKQLKSLGYVR
jgi:arylsulfatase